MANALKNYIPNAVTCLNLFSGCIASVMAFEARYDLAPVSYTHLDVYKRQDYQYYALEEI